MIIKFSAVLISHPSELLYPRRHQSQRYLLEFWSDFVLVVESQRYYTKSLFRDQVLPVLPSFTEGNEGDNADLFSGR